MNQPRVSGQRDKDKTWTNQFTCLGFRSLNLKETHNKIP